MCCGKTCSAYTRVQAKTTVLTAILRGCLKCESPYTRVWYLFIFTRRFIVPVVNVRKVPLLHMGYHQLDCQHQFPSVSP